MQQEVDKVARKAYTRESRARARMRFLSSRDSTSNLRAERFLPFFSRNFIHLSCAKNFLIAHAVSHEIVCVKYTRCVPDVSTPETIIRDYIV